MSKSKPPIDQFIEENRLVRKPEVQTLLNISRATLARWIKSGKFIQPTMIQSGRAIWHFKDVKQWIDDQQLITQDSSSQV